MSSADPVPIQSTRRRIVTLARLVLSADRRLLIAMGALVIFVTLGWATQSLAIKWIIDGAADGRWAFTTRAALLGGLAAGVVGACGRIYMNLQVWAAIVVGLEVSRTTVTHAASMPGLEHLERSDFRDQVSIATKRGSEFVYSAFAVPNLVMLTARIAVVVWLLATVHPLLILVSVFVVPSVLLSSRAQRHIDRATNEVAELRRAADHLHGLFAEPNAAMEMRLFGAANKLSSRADVLWRRGSRVSFSGAIRATAVSAVGWLLLGAAYVSALAFTALRASTGEATPGDVLLVSQLTLQLRWDVFQTTSSVRDALGALRLTDRVLWLDDQAKEQASAFAGRGVDPPDRLDDGIRFDDVSFMYPGTTRTVLEGLTFRVPAGATVAIVGENGSGKTTLIKLLCRYYDPTTGRITVDGRALTDFEPRAWRTRLTASFQDFLRLEAIVRESVGVGHLPQMGRDERVLDAIDRGTARRVLDLLPRGLDTHLGKSYTDGSELSGGEWQRIALSRAMMPPEPLVLVLDEPTANLDPSAEHAIYERYSGAANRARAAGGVVILVSHRFSTVKMADLILVLEHGRLAEMGTHAELVAAGGSYARMYLTQARAYS